MKVTFQLTPQDYHRGLLCWRNLKAWRRWLLRLSYLIVGLTVPLAILLTILGRDYRTLKLSAGILAFAALWLLFMFGGPRLSAHRQFRNTPSAHRPITMEASASGLHFESVHADSTVQWSAYVAWGECKSLFIILPQPRIYVPIPKRAFSGSQLTEFTELLRQNIMPSGR